MAVHKSLAWWESRPGVRRHLVTGVLALALAVLVGWIVWDRAHANREAETATANAEAMAQALQYACAHQDTADPVLVQWCHRADEVAEEPAEPVAVPPTEEQLRPLVREFVDAWLAANPPRDGQDGEDGRTPTVDELAALIAAEYARNPPADGHTPTPEEIRPIVAEEVAAYLLANPPPPGEPGQPGRDGVDGQDGVDGRDGVDGQPAAGWTQPCASLLDPDQRCSCTRDPGSPDDAPTYTCRPI